jgi:hypothetical protein
VTVATALERRRDFYARHGRRPLESGSGHRLFYAADGTLIDRYGRSYEQVLAGAQLAGRLAERSAELAEDVERADRDGKLVLDQVAGRRFLERYDYNAFLLSQIANRDSGIARQLVVAEAEDAAALGEAGRA